MADPAVHAEIPALLLLWADTERRDLPWRRTRDPWCILVSEAMLQQTQVARVLDRYQEFIQRFPTAEECASAPSSAVIELWSGLGFNRRAVNLWRAAQVLTEEHAGRFPQDYRTLVGLPGVGPYTARALQAFAFEQDVGVLDTNVGRLLARWSGQSLKSGPAQALADELVPPGKGWVWNQSLFDFAVAVCTKQAPACDSCTLRSRCRWQGHGDDPAARSAAVSGKQSTFEGSKRQVRGRIVEALRSGPIPIDDLSGFGRPGDSPADIDDIVAGLFDDGLAIRTGDHLTLP